MTCAAPMPAALVSPTKVRRTDALTRDRRPPRTPSPPFLNRPLAPPSESLLPGRRITRRIYPRTGMGSFGVIWGHLGSFTLGLVWGMGGIRSGYGDWVWPQLPSDWVCGTGYVGLGMWGMSFTLGLGMTDWV
jgi:hypothetical protein